MASACMWARVPGWDPLCPGPTTPQDPRFIPLCLSADEIRRIVVETHTLGWAYKICHFCNPVLACKEYWEP